MRVTRVVRVTAATRLRETRGPLLSILLGCLVVATLIWGPSSYGVVTADGRLSPELEAADRPRDVVVTLGFSAEPFHRRQLSAYGVFGGTPTDHQVNLLQVPPFNLYALSHVYWVDSIDPMGE